MKRIAQISAGLALALCMTLHNQNTLGCSTNQLVAYYAFDGDANDRSGRGLNGTITNAFFVSGQVGLGLNFISTNSFVEVSHDDSLSPTNAVSVSLWVKVRSFPNDYSCLVYKAAVAPDSTFADRSYSMWVRADGGIHWTSTPDDGAVGQVILNSAADGIPTNQWTHVVGTVDTETRDVKVYINGSLVASAMYYLGSKIRRGNFPLRIGGPFITSGDQTGLDGVLDEVRIYDRVLTDEEVICLYTGGNNAPSLRIRRSQAAEVEVCWNSRSNTTYQVQYCTNLTGNQWSSPGCVQGSGGTNCLYDTIALPTSRRFYRLAITNCVP